MKRAAILIDDWKLPVFKRRLEEAGFTFEQLPGLNASTVTLRVMCDSPLNTLAPIVKAANAECAASKMN